MICLLVTALSSMTMDGQGSLRPRGDVNCDWEVNIADINALLDSVISDAQYHSFYSYATDVNGDKEINIADINTLIGAILGDELPPMPSYSGSLPVLFIITEGHRNIDSKEEYLHADWWLDAMGIPGYESIGSASKPLGMLIKGRGNYTWTASKKPFRIKLDKKQPLLGMKSNRHFCLLAHADDHLAKLKNAMGFELSRRIGMPYTPEQKPLEVVLNGQYIGLYFLADKIRVEKDRVNIEEQDNGEAASDYITGGWLLEIDNNKNENTIYVRERNNGINWYDWLWVTPHSPDSLSPQQKSYIQQHLEKVNAAIYNQNKASTEWEQYIDIDSLARFYIIGEILDDTEHFSGSCYMYKHRGDSTKLIIGPTWDFGGAFQRLNYTGVANFNYYLYQQPTYFHSHWIEEIAKYPHFQLAVRRQWNQFYNSHFNGLDIDNFCDNHVQTIRQAWYSNAARWTGNSIDWEAYLFKLYIHSKIDWLQSQWGMPDKVDPNGPEVRHRND